MNAHKVETILAEDGTLILRDLPFHAGDTVEIIILERPSTLPEKVLTNQLEPTLYPLRGKQPYHYEDPFEPAVPPEEWEVLQ
jgi:hypothetical protein